jgi:hypothetical protein
MNCKEDLNLRIEFLEKLLSALLGDNWRDLTLEDAEIYRMKIEGDQINVLSKLSKMANDEFDGRSRVEMTIFGDGTMECYQESVVDVSDKFEHQTVKIKTPQTCYRITEKGMHAMLMDLKCAEWMDATKQTAQGARAEIDWLSELLSDYANGVLKELRRT